MKPLLLLLLLLNATLFANEAILKLDTLGHTGIIKDILVSKDRSEIISASDDKTIRVWDTQTGKEKRKILGSIGAGSEGKIFAIALSGDNRYLAVGGYLAGEELSDKTAIRIYNYKTGKLLRVLQSHTNVVYDLSFSSDDNYLVSGSADTTVKIWQTTNWQLQESINSHTNDVYAVKMLKSENGYDIYSAGFDNKVALHRFKLNRVEYINSYRANYNLDYLAINERDIATCGTGKEILIFDRELHLKQTLQSETTPAGLAYSPNGESLVAGSRSDVNYEMVNIYDAKSYSCSSFVRK